MTVTNLVLSDFNPFKIKFIKMKCYVPSCQTDFHHLPEGISKHKFPTDEDRQLEWVRAISTAESVDLDASKIDFRLENVCSKHFDQAFIYKVGQRNLLSKNAVPFTPFRSERFVEDCMTNFLVDHILYL